MTCFWSSVLFLCFILNHLSGCTYIDGKNHVSVQSKYGEVYLNENGSIAKKNAQTIVVLGRHCSNPSVVVFKQITLCYHLDCLAQTLSGLSCKLRIIHNFMSIIMKFGQLGSRYLTMEL